MNTVLRVRDLHTTFFTSAGEARAVDGVSFEIRAGETVALVGESGCGKSALGASLMRLVPPPGRIVRGTVQLEERDLLTLDSSAMRDLRGRRIALIPQEPSAALSPTMRVGDQVAEVLRVHGERSARVAGERAVRMLERVGLADPARGARNFPHQLSGGMRQRVLIAMALLLEPALVIADEPTTALDVTVQKQILDLLTALQSETGTAVLFITHDLALVAQHCSRVMVMYAGQIVEEAPTPALFRAPAHPYTRGLLRSMPRLGGEGLRLAAIPGTVPSPTEWPALCRFRERCVEAVPRCDVDSPELLAVADGSAARCHLAQLRAV
jgi:peptide/nickel transport system ATP-binding protein